MNITRRQFLQYCTASAAALGLSQTDLLKLKDALAANVCGCNDHGAAHVIWLQGQSCGGCTYSITNRVLMADDNVPELGLAVQDVVDLLVGDAAGFVTLGTSRAGWAPFPNGYISLDYQSVIMAGAGNPTGSNGDVNNYLQCLRAAGGYIVAVSGAIPRKDMVLLGNNKAPKYCVVGEHAIPNFGDSATFDTGKFGTGHDPNAHTGRSIVEVLPWLAENALATVSFGTCSSYGGVPGAQGNRTQAISVDKFLNGTGSDELNMGAAVVNIPGCAPHPDWMTYPVAYFLIHSALPTLDMTVRDGVTMKRPTALYGPDAEKGYTIMCDGPCPRRALRTAGFRCSDVGAGPGNGDGSNQKEWCLIDVGCNGPFCVADCPTRRWNNFDAAWVAGGGPITHQRNSFCVDANNPCQGCVEHDFPDGRSPFYMAKSS